MITPLPTLIVPVEMQVRELDAKLLLACVAAEKGFPVVLGAQTRLHLRIHSFPRGIYLAKDIRASRVRMFKILKRLGHQIVAWDEEGFVRYPSHYYFKTRVCPRALKEVAMFFAWGPDDAELLERHPGYEGTAIMQTGNPRVDLLRDGLRGFFDQDVRMLRQRFGHFILINTNFGHANHYLPKYTMKIPLDESGQPSKDGTWEGDLAFHRNALFNRFQDMVPKLARAFPQKTIILRPHPSENTAVWERAASGCSNVHVVQEGSVLPWLLACDVVVHNGCTTAVEGFLAGRPAVTYRPIVSKRFDRHFPDALSYNAFDLDQLVASIAPFVENPPGEVHTDDQRVHLDKHLVSQDGDLACERIVDLIHSSPIIGQAQRPASTMNIVTGWLHARGRTVEKSIRSLIPGRKNWWKYEKHRFSGTTVCEINRKIRLLEDLSGRFEGVRARRISNDIFHIERP